MTDEPYTVDDYHDAIYEKGPLAYLWKDKPHRLVIELCAQMRRLEAKEKEKK